MTRNTKTVAIIGSTFFLGGTVFTLIVLQLSNEKQIDNAVRIPKAALENAHSILTNSDVRIVPINIGFSLPDKWLENDAKCRKYNIGACIFSSPAELETVNRGEGSYYRVITNLCNSVLPSDRCAISAGYYPWGINGSGPILRVYDIDDHVPDIVGRIGSKGKEAIFQMTGATAEFKHTTKNDWKLTSASVRCIDDDLVISMQFDFFARRFGDRTLVFIFIDSNDADQVLNSVRQL